MRNVYAVVRVDNFKMSSSWPTNAEQWNSFVTVKEIVATLAEAESEVSRLNELNAAKDCLYFCQATRYGGTLRDRRQ
jgi:hypothetical protein